MKNKCIKPFWIGDKKKYINIQSLWFKLTEYEKKLYWFLCLPNLSKQREHVVFHLFVNRMLGL